MREAFCQAHRQPGWLHAHGVPQRFAQAHLRHKDPRLTANVYTDERLLPVASAIAELPWLPTEPTNDAAAQRATGTVGRSAERAAPGAARRTLSGAETGTVVHNFDGARTPAPETQVPAEAGTYRKSRPEKEKRVIGFEPTTFTLAT